MYIFKSCCLYVNCAWITEPQIIVVFDCCVVFDSCLFDDITTLVYIPSLFYYPNLSPPPLALSLSILK